VLNTFKETSMAQDRGSKLFSRRDFLKLACTAAGGLVVAGCDQGTPTPTSQSRSPSPAPPVYSDPHRPMQERVNDLIDRMSIDEIVSQMQSEAPPIQRLGIPGYNWWNEALHGVARAGVATVFPQVIGLASTWNTDLIRRIDRKSVV
jgi:beta-glucosidase-like glycosyl hydrolase